MEHRELGRTGIRLSTIGFGVWTVASGWWGEYTEAQAVELIRRAYDAGITFFNTGNTYGSDGYGERIVRLALEDVYEHVQIGTTFGYEIGEARVGGTQRERPQDWSPTHIRSSLEQSLEYLGRDHIDVWQLHNPKMDAMHDDTLWGELAKIKAEGLVGAVGPSIGPRIGWRDEGVFCITERDIDFVHHIYNLLEQDPGREFTELAAEREIGVLVRVPHSSGLLEGNLTADTVFPASDHRSHRPKEWLTEGLHKVEHLAFLLDGRDATLGQVALKWLLSDPAITSVNPNIYNAEQIIEFAAANEVDELDADELGDVDMLFKANYGLALQEA